MKEKVDFLLAKSMEQNIITGGIVNESDDENVKSKMLKLLHQTMAIKAEPEEIVAAYRFGVKRNKPRQIMLMAKLGLRDRILDNTHNLKYKKNEEGRYYMVNKQLPDTYQEQRRDVRENMKGARELNQKLPMEKGAKLELVNRQLVINGEI